ncbi:MAG TPA: CHAT domain-containing protein [Coleofasciculaceae cyanobacterium]
MINLGEAVVAQPLDTQQVVQEGIDKYQAGDYKGAIAIWQTVVKAHPIGTAYSSAEVNILQNLVKAYQQIGQIESTIAYFDQLISYYRQIGNIQQMGRMLTEQAQAYSTLGHHQQAITLLCNDNPVDSTCSPDSALTIARRESDALGEAAAVGSLGNTYLLQGEFEQATKYLQKSLEISRKLGNASYISTALNSLGNLHAKLAKRNYSRAKLATESNEEAAAENFRQTASDNAEKATQYFEDSLELAHRLNDEHSEIRALLNLSELSYRRYRIDSSTKAQTQLQRVGKIWQNLSNSSDKVFSAIKLAYLLQQSTQLVTTPTANPATQCFGTEMPKEAVELLKQAILIAQQIQNRQAESFALGALGHVYECGENYDLALSLTQQAQVAGITKESLYLWEWQAGRILKTQDKIDDAIAAYAKAIETLKSIRSNLIIATRDLQLDFRETIEPIYRQYTELTLDQVSNSNALSNPQDNLESALTTIDELRLAELQNYLSKDCQLTPITKPLALVDQNTAVISSIILPERTAIILTLPDETGKFSSQLHWLPVKSQDFIEIINDFRLKLEKRSDRTNAYRERAQQLYDWLVKPFALELEQQKVKSLVFVQDGILRSIPMAALYDGKQFLIEKYGIANVPTLTLVNPTQLNPGELRVLAFGLTQPSAVDDKTVFKPLSYVKLEIENLTATIPNSKALLNEEFTTVRLQQELETETYPIIHLATHGKFGFDSNETYLVTGKLLAKSNQPSDGGERYNEKLTMNELYQIIRNLPRSNNSIELLTLTACETAAGSDRDALGIAGISIQAGAKSAIASLWQVDDQATAQIIAQFYQGLQQGLKKAEALQIAQKTWLKEHNQGLHSHPGFWSPLILIGNWL